MHSLPHSSRRMRRRVLSLIRSVLALFPHTRYARRMNPCMDMAEMGTAMGATTVAAAAAVANL